MDMHEMWSKAVDWFSTSGFQVLVILIFTSGMLISVRLVGGRLIASYKKRQEDGESQKRAETLGAMLRYVISIVVLSLGLMLLLEQFGIQLGPLLAAAGVAGIAIGFGAQHLVSDVIRGFFIMMNNEIRVGDVVEVAGKSGVVESINLRITVLRDLSGNVHYVPNGKIDIVTNMTVEYSRCTIDIGVSYRESVDEVIEVMREVDQDLRADEIFGKVILEPIEILGLERFDDSAVVVRARYTTKPIKQWNVKREFNRRLKIAFDSRGIEIPFPHLTLYIGQDKDGKAAALKVMNESPPRDV